MNTAPYLDPENRPICRACALGLDPFALLGDEEPAAWEDYYVLSATRFPANPSPADPCWHCLRRAAQPPD